MKKYIRQNRILLWPQVLLNAVYGVLSALVPVAAGVIIDYDPSSGQKIFGIPGLKGLALLGLFFLSGVVVSGLLKALFKSLYLRRVSVQLESDVFHAAVRSGISSASLVNMFCTEIEWIMDYYFINHGELVSILVPFAVALAYSLSVSWMTIAIIFGSFAVLVLLNQVLLAPMKKYMAALSKSNEAVNQTLLGLLNAATSLKIYGGIDYAFRRIREALEKRNKTEKSKADYEVFVEGINCLFSTLLQIVPLAIIAVMVVSGKLTVGAALSMMLLFEKIVSPIDQVSVLRTEYAQSKPYRDSVGEFIAGHTGPEHKAAGAPRPAAGGILAVNHLDVRIEDKQIIRGFSAEFEPGKKYLVVGRNGTGKSTLLKVLTKQITDFGGSVRLAGRDLRDIPESELFETVGIVPQHPEIFEDTIYSNITLGKAVSHTRVLEAMKLAGLPADRLWEKVSENRNNFSGGELQRIVLARMFCHPRQVWCLDEVVSGLQNELAGTIENTIIDRIDGTVINVSHRTGAMTVRKYDAVINMDSENRLRMDA